MKNSVETHLRETPYWRKVAEEYGDLEEGVKTAIRDIESWRDMVDVLGLNNPEKSEHFAKAMRNTSYKNFVPESKLEEIYAVGESGGTTGSPKNAPLPKEDWFSNIERFNEYLDNAGIPRDEDMLWIGPQFPPHTIAAYARDLAESRGGNILGIDLDPRILKKFGREGMQDSLERYKKHIGKQVKDLVKSQDVGYTFTTADILEEMAGKMDVDKLDLDGIIQAGAPLSQEQNRVFQEEIYDDMPFTGGFGTALTEFTGIQLLDTDDYEVIYLSAGPTRRLEVYDDDGKLCDYGEKGTLATSKVTENFLMPAYLEEDEAVMVESPSYLDTDLPCVKDIVPSKSREEKNKGGVY